ncbi:hypothetical protein Avbf_08844 [Armadillidium vulgare]|nr:hypothetical protein Avbf_08844 [Armadillidium vulgare]
MSQSVSLKDRLFLVSLSGSLKIKTFYSKTFSQNLTLIINWDYLFLLVVLLKEVTVSGGIEGR